MTEPRTLLVVEHDTLGTPGETDRDRDLVALEEAEHELAELEAELGDDGDAPGT